MVILWIRTYCVIAEFQLSIPRIFFLLFLVLFAMISTWFLYRREWRKVLGLNTKGITAKVIWKSFAVGLLINLICSTIISVIYYLIFKESPLDPLGEEHNMLKILSSTLILAPLTEELLFRGFIQGLWQKLYENQTKTPIKLIIVITALLFAISHFGFLNNVTVKQFLLTFVGIFILALYLSYLRYKYQSIIPSIFAHVGANFSMIIVPIIGIFLALVSPNALRETSRQKEILKYENDTISYNFDPNDSTEWKRSYDKFVAFKRPRSEEIIKHLKGTATNVHVYFTIDTCGNIHNIKSIDTIWVKKSRGKMDKYPAEVYYIQEYGYDFTKDAIKFIESLPQCKPYIEDEKKIEKKMSESVPFYPY